MADMEERFLEAAMVERKGINGLAISGFVISLSAGALFAAALLCQLGVMLGPLSALAFGVLAGAAAACGAAHSAVTERFTLTLTEGYTPAATNLRYGLHPCGCRP